MKKVLIIGNFHHKNYEGLDRILNHLKYEFKHTNDISDIENYDIIYSPGCPIDTSRYPNKKFIFGPHFSVFPDDKLTCINNIHNNSVYIQPSDWARDLWINMDSGKYIPLKSFPFPVNTDKFKPNDSKEEKTKIFGYYKSRETSEIEYIEKYFEDRNIEFKMFHYYLKYEEEDYLNYLKESKYGIVVDAHESQGFALEEALSTNVPLLVWNTRDMSQEVWTNYDNIHCTTIPYWDERCGEFFYEQSEFIETYEKFLKKIDTYKPREYIMENLSVEVCAERFKELITYV